MKRLLALTVMLVVLASCAMAQSQYTILQFNKERLDSAKVDTIGWFSGYYDGITLTTNDKVLSTGKNKRTIYVDYKYFFKVSSTVWDSSIITRTLVAVSVDSVAQAYSYDLTGSGYRGFKSFRVRTLVSRDSTDHENQLFFLK